MSHRHAIVLSIYLNTRGFAFIVFEGPLAPFDWGIREMRGPGKYKLCLTRIMQLFDRYALDVLVIQDTSKHGTERAPWISNLNAAIAAFAKDRDIPILAYSRDQVQGMFEPYGCPNKQRRAELIAKHIHVLSVDRQGSQVIRKGYLCAYGLLPDKLSVKVETGAIERQLLTKNGEHTELAVRSTGSVDAVGRHRTYRSLRLESRLSIRLRSCS
ncbi:hypothetical protein QNJ95_37200 [Bradyrhizobium elkanii]|uniref:hypothetical protein n=1 Tax=Bradyrhizobium elkanii TaxID=29448 RepID=UPI0027121744|nr:hypothetical protein [Bradyrhizobium elkanii]WLA38518.1 hypothetical protein QNJ95_37200 [Bradyrhizobium elkanii]